MGLSPSGGVGYGVDGGSGRSHLPSAPSAPSVLPAPRTPLSVVSIPSPSRPFAGVMPKAAPPVVTTAAKSVFATISKLAASLAPPVGSASAPPPPAVLRTSLAPLRRASAFFNPTATAQTGPALPVPRLLLAGALVYAGLELGGAWRLLAAAGGLLGASAVYTYVRAAK